MNDLYKTIQNDPELREVDTLLSGIYARRARIGFLVSIGLYNEVTGQAKLAALDTQELKLREENGFRRLARVYQEVAEREALQRGDPT
ncbi:hypothetical protein ACFLZP_04215 [Patescibacteria group bacterium]